MLIFIESTKLDAIGDAIREKLETDEKFSVDDMPDAILSIISGGGGSGTLGIIENGPYDVTEYAEALVDVPTGTSRSGVDVTFSQGNVIIPAGLFAEAVTKAITAGLVSNPVATVGEVEDHAVEVTPSVTNTEGYVMAGTKTGTPVTVSASDLVSGSTTKTTNGTFNVTNLASIVVAIPEYDGTVE